MPISNADIEKVCGLKLSTPLFEGTGLIDGTASKTLSFVDDVRYVKNLLENPNILGVFTTQEISAAIPNEAMFTIICEEPRLSFYLLHNYIAERDYVKWPSVIDPTANVHPRAFISDNNVVIGPNSIIEANATILADVTLGESCLIGAGAVLGCDDAEIKVTSKGLLRAVHDGELRVGDHVHIGANCTVDKGFSFRHTIIGNGTKLGNSTFIGHGAHIDTDCMLLSCIILGSANIGARVRVNPGAVISNQVEIGDDAIVSIGAVVVQSVTSETKVTGNFAVEHQKFLYGHTKTFGRF